MSNPQKQDFRKFAIVVLSLLLFGLLTLLIGAITCDISQGRQVECTSGKAHTWEKWHDDGRTNMDGDTWLVRRCTVCGYQQGTFSSRQ